MPYTNIVWIKLFLSLFEEDDKFLYQLNESQQLLYIKLLYLAGSTDNEIPKNINFICNKINYHHEQACLLADIKRIKEVFNRFEESDDFYYFNNFHELHNRMPKNKIVGHTKDARRVVPEKEKEKEKDKTLHLDFVKLTKQEYDALKARFGGLSAENYIERLNDYIAQFGKDKYKSHYHTILNWSRKDESDKSSGKPISRASLNKKY